MKTNVLAGSIDLSTICGNPENCLSWLIILLDVFAIFYLVFVSFYRVTKLVRMIGWIWLGVLITADIIILAIHPCILTLLCILFTIMIMTAILSVVLPNYSYESDYREDREDRGEKPKRNAKCGSYVIREINEKKYCYELYDKQNKFLVRSYNCYLTVDDVKEAIRSTRKNGEIAEIEDRTANWIKEANHPKFELYKEDGLYFYKLSVDNKTLLFKSNSYDVLQDCKKQLDKAVAAVKSLEVYLSIERLLADEASQYKDKKAISYSGEEEKKPVKLESKKEEKQEAIEHPVHVEEAPKAEGQYVEDGSVVIATADKKTLWESYEELSKEQKGFFDGLRKAAQEKEGSREFESSTQLAYAIFRDKLMRIQIKRNKVEAIFMLMDSSFKQIQGDKDIKIKETKTTIKIENKDYYNLALETLNKKYNLLLEQKAERENQKRLERLEKSKQKRLADKAKV